MRHLIYKPGNTYLHQQIGKELRDLPVKDEKGRELEYVVTIKAVKSVRSIPQNKYYRAVLTLIAARTGQGSGDKHLDQDQLHEFFKKKFNGELFYFPKAGSELFGKTTTDLDTREFTVFVNRVKQWALEEYQLVIPDRVNMNYAQWMQIETDYDRTFSGL